MSKHAVITFARANPPTSGHRLLVDTMIAQGKQLAQNADISQVSLFIILSPKQDSKQNPLPLEFREQVLDGLVKEDIHIGLEKQPKTLLEAMTYLDEAGFEDVTVVVGSDRVLEFQDLLDKYNGNPDGKGNLLYEFETISVVQAGSSRSGDTTLDPDSSSDISKVSATALRTAAANNDFDTFREGFFDPSEEAIAREVFEELQVRMGVEVNNTEDDQLDGEDLELDQSAEDTQQEVQEAVRSARVHGVRTYTTLNEATGLAETSFKVRSATLTILDETRRSTNVEIDTLGSHAEQARDLAETIAIAADASSRPLTLRFHSTKTQRAGYRGALVREAIRRLPKDIQKKVDVQIVH